MGKGTIIGETGGGLYTVDIEFDTTAAETEASKLETILAKVQAGIDAGPGPAELGFLKMRKTALTKEIARIQAAADTSRTASAWCADLTEGLTGTVGTIEIGTEAENGVNIQPGYGDNQVYDVDRDGIETPFLTMNVADAMRNFAVMPAIQKYKPTYRYATISDIDTANHTCTVTFEACHSTIQGLDINPVSTASDVPIEYMGCDSAAFEDGDSVIVRFDPYDDEGQPKVIGIKDNPKTCGYHLKLASVNGVAFNPGPNSYQLRITQPIPSQVTHYRKGTYTEDFTVIGSGICDDAGVAEITIDAGASIDQDYPVNIAVKNSNKWIYYTSDWRGSAPDIGVIWPAGKKVTNYPTGDLSGYDYLLDRIYWIQMGVDLRTAAEASFQNADGDTVSGFEVDLTGVKLIRRKLVEYVYTDANCDGVSAGGAISYPVNETTEALRIVKEVPYDLNPDDHSPAIGSPFYFTPQYCQNSPVATCDCYGVLSSNTIRYLFSIDSSMAVMTSGRGDPYAMTASRLGLSPYMAGSGMNVDGDFNILEKYTWLSTVAGGGGKTCEAGEDTGGCGEVARVWEQGFSSAWELIDLDSDHF